MIRGAGRAAAAAVLGALAGATWLALTYGSSPALNLEFDVTPPREIVRGIYTAERDPGTGRTFVWSADAVTLSLADLDRQVPWAMDVRVRGARAGDQQNPALQFYVDGVLVHTYQTTVDYGDVRVAIPPRPAQSGVAIEMRSSTTFVPGPADPRVLGVMLDRLTLTPSGVVLPPRAAFEGVALASAAAGAALALLGVTAGSAVGGVLLVSAALAALVARGFGPYVDFPDVAARATLWIGGGTALLVAAVRRRRLEPFRNTARFAIAFSASALLLKLLVLLHPDMPIGDALFHAHRFQEVLAGAWYFTSTAPGGYQFPYAPGLYVCAIPFSSLVPRGPSDMTLLRTIVCVADAMAGLLLYGMAVRIRGDRLAGAVAVALYHLIPLGFGVVAVGNLTNAFAQSLSVAALAAMASGAVRLENRSALALLTFALLAAFLSHSSAFAIGSVASCLVAVMFWWRGGPALRSPAIAVLLAASVAVLLAVATYYAHFLDTYRTELSRIGTETAAAAPDAGGRSIGGRLALVPGYLRGYYGIPSLALAFWGAGLLWSRGARDRVTLAGAGWALACLIFLALGIVTPVDMRHYLAAVPVVALGGAVGAAIVWTSPGSRRIVALVLLGWAVVAGIDAWWSTLDVGRV
jgi:hypothetical protein